MMPKPRRNGATVDRGSLGRSLLGGFDESHRACGFALCGLRARDRTDVGVPVDTQGQRAACLLRQDFAPDRSVQKIRERTLQ